MTQFSIVERHRQGRPMERRVYATELLGKAVELDIARADAAYEGAEFRAAYLATCYPVFVVFEGFGVREHMLSTLAATRRCAEEGVPERQLTAADLSLMLTGIAVRLVGFGLVQVYASRPTLRLVS